MGPDGSSSAGNYPDIVVAHRDMAHSKRTVVRLAFYWNQVLHSQMVNSACLVWKRMLLL